MIIIKEVKTKRELKNFIKFPINLYKDNEYFVPAINKDELDKFNPKKNPAYEFCETKLFLAYRDNKIVGRVAGLISYAYIKKINKNIMRFTRFDVIDELDVSKALIEAVKDWGRSKGIYSLMGPIGFTDIDIQGMLVEGFEEHNLSLTIYNHQYYNTHLEKLGFKKDADWVEYQVEVPEVLDERIGRIAMKVADRYGYKRVYFKNNKEIYPYAYEAFKLVNLAFEKLYGTVVLTEKIIDQVVKQYIPLLTKEFVFIITNKEDEVIGFGLALPSIASAVKKSKGRLFPFGIFRLIKALKTYDILEMYLIAVKPEYQNHGVNSIILTEAVKEAKKLNVKIAESGPELETNSEVQAQWKTFKSRQHRRRRCYILEFNEN